jgi:hypothetical protein
MSRGALEADNNVAMVVVYCQRQQLLAIIHVLRREWCKYWTHKLFPYAVDPRSG